MDTYVVVGAGHCGSRAADCLRRSGFKGRVLLVGAEPHLPYQRPPLCKKYLVDGMPLDRLVLRHRPFYERSNIELRFNTVVTSIDPDYKRLELLDGGEIFFDKLLLCIGSRPRSLNVPGKDLSGIHLLRTLDDARALRAEFVPGRRLVIIGAGYIGLEAAATARGLGFDVTVVELSDRVMPRVASYITADFYLRRHRAAGVQFLFNRACVGFVGTHRVEAVQTADGLIIPADIVIVSIGNIPETKLAAAAGLECGDGVLVDEYCRTSVPDIFAAGDCTDHPNMRYGRRVRLQSIDNAIEQARVAAAAMCEYETLHNHIPWFWSDQYETKLQIAGLSEDFDELITRGDPDNGAFSVWCMRKGELLSAELVNRPLEFMQAGKWIAEHKKPDRRQLADPTINLGAL